MGLMLMKSLAIVSTQKKNAMFFLLSFMPDYCLSCVSLKKIAPELRVRVKVVHLRINPRKHC